MLSLFSFFKLIKPFFSPPAWIVIGMLLSLILFVCRKNRLGKRILAFTLIIYYLLSTEAISYLLIRTIETRDYPLPKVPKVEAIVVLAGGADKAGGLRPRHEFSGNSWRRLWHGIEIYRQFKGKIPILYSGGFGDPFDTVPVEAELAASIAISIGIPKGKFWIENSSRDTYESGVEVKKILALRFPRNNQHKVILVTSAFHQRRAQAVFKKLGIAFLPSSADYYSGSLNLDPLSFFPEISSFEASYLAIHEWVGIASYWLRGRI